MSAESPLVSGTVFADRFASMSSGGAWDLALDVPAWIGVADVAADGRREWCDRIASVAMLQHPSLARCLDFGEVGDRVFGAFETMSGIATRRSQGVRPGDSLEEFLRACDVPAVAVCRHPVHSSIWLPSDVVASAPGPAEIPECRERQAGRKFPRGRAAFGVRLQRRPEWDVLLELLEAANGWPPWIALRGDSGSGRTTTVRWLAREARIRGWRPVAASVLVRQVGGHGPVELPLADHRQWLVLDDGTVPQGRRALARALTTAFGASDHAPVVISTSGDRPWGAVEIRVTPFTADDLRRIAVTPRSIRPDTMARLADEAHGNPAAYLAALGLMPTADGPHGCLPRVARESVAVGGVVLPPTVNRGARALRLVQPDAGAAALLRRADVADTWMARGRHAAAERLLRECAEGLARRGAPCEAAMVQHRLGCLLLRRGRAVDAIEVADSAAHRAGSDGALVWDLWWLRGIALYEAARLTDADTTFRRMTLSATDAAGTRALRTVLASTALWRGRIDEAEALLDGEAPVDASPTDRLDWHIGCAEVAFGRGDLFQAGRHAHAAVSLASSITGVSAGRAPVGLGDPSARALVTRARVSAAAGDLAAAVRDATGARRQAVAARCPRTAIRALIASAALFDRASQQVRVQVAVRQLRRCLRGALPPLLRIEVCRAVVRHDRAGPDRPVLRRRTAALSRMAGIPDAWWDRGELDPVQRQEGGPMLDAVLRVLELCHGADDERRTLEGVAGLVRDQTGASTVAFLGLDGAVLSPLAWAGARPRCDGAVVAQRAVESGLPLPPQVTGQGCEAAVPVRYGTAPVGVLACRWLPGHERGRDVMTLLSATAAAAAPCLRVALDRRLPPREDASGMPELVGTSAAIAQVRQAAARAAAAPFPVLIVGESGAGKELVARAIHRLGPRRERRFCEVNAAALSDELLESELFGHARGSFTGAIADRPGLFEEAHGGTLFLDEVGELSPRAQAKLLRALQEGEIRRVGETCSRKVDVRIVAATNRSLPAEVEAARFRHDLMYRLDVVRIAVPPLRDRAEDIPLLTQTFWAAAVARTGSRATLAPETVTALAQYRWPGNVRELQNVLAAMVVAAPARGRVGVSGLPAALTRGTPSATGQTLEEARRHFEERFVRAVMVRAGGHRGQAAAELGLTRQGLAKLLQRLGLEVPSLRTAGEVPRMQSRSD